MSLTHLDASGRAEMVDVGAKPETARRAVAEGRVIMSAEAFEQVQSATVAKGDVITVAELAGVMGAKRTSDLIPLCHPVPLSHLTVAVELEASWPGVRVVASATATARTGVEMEALVAVSVACLTVYDMVKAVDKGMRIDRIRLLEKSGGRRGTWLATDEQHQHATEAE
ncbi:MAG: cyclic pyranopterin monophosphate synthase MoaC [Gemmatimonadota bacterium]